jgi:putative flippase GtrA
MSAEPLSHPVAGRFIRFAITGVVAAGVDMAVLTLCVRWIGLDLYSARVASYLAAATTAWWINRRISFADRSSSNRAREWLRYLAANLLGGIINYAVYAVLVSASAVFAQHPLLAVAAGSLSGLLSNFAMSQRYVFVGL